MKLRGSDGYTGDAIAQFERILAQDIVFHSGRYFRFPFPSFEGRVSAWGNMVKIIIPNSELDGETQFLVGNWYLRKIAWLK